MSSDFENRFPAETPPTEEEAEARRAQARHALERLATLEEQGHENIVHRSPERLAELRARHLAERNRRATLALKK